ncbi:hypothetical protein GCM10010872_26510 [Dyella flava]|nr:hypothetical protein GCM10010872_26510 [Dyella flava]
MLEGDVMPQSFWEGSPLPSGEKVRLKGDLAIRRLQTNALRFYRERTLHLSLLFHRDDLAAVPVERELAVLQIELNALRQR